MVQERIVVRGLNWLGDAIMSLPALQRLREARPDAHIAILTPSKLADLWTPPLIDEVIRFEKRESMIAIVRRVRAGRFSAGLVLPMSFRSALEFRLAGIPIRVGREHRGRAFLFSHRVPVLPDIVEMRKRTVAEVRLLARQSGATPAPAVPPRSHHVYRYLALASALGASPEPMAPCLPISDLEANEALCRFGVSPGTAESPLFAMCPGGEYGAAKRWPDERFIEAACILSDRTGCRWLLFGGAAEEAACRRIVEVVAERMGRAAIRCLAGQTSLRELAGLLKSCSLMLGNDSGPMHLAAAVGTPVAGVFSSTSAALTGPGLPGEARHLLLTSTAACSPCFLRTCPIDMRCMDSLGVERVVQAILRSRESCVAR